MIALKLYIDCGWKIVYLQGKQHDKGGLVSLGLLWVFFDFSLYDILHFIDNNPKRFISALILS